MFRNQMTMTQLPQKPTKKQIAVRLVAIFVLSIVFAVGSIYLKGEKIHWNIMMYVVIGMAIFFVLIGVMVSIKPAIENTQDLKKSVKKQSTFFLLLGMAGVVLLFLQLIVAPEDFSMERVITPAMMIILAGIGFARYQKID